MTTPARILMVVLVGGALLMAATVAVGAAALYGAGTIAVEVQEDRGDHVSVRVPAGLANLALNLIPDAAVDRALREVSHEIDPYIPAVQDAWARLEATGDFVLVEATEGSDHVVVRKRGNQLLINVDGPDTHVDIALPIRTLGKIVRKL